MKVPGCPISLQCQSCFREGISTLEGGSDASRGAAGCQDFEKRETADLKEQDRNITHRNVKDTPDLILISHMCEILQYKFRVELSLLVMVKIGLVHPNPIPIPNWTKECSQRKTGHRHWRC